MKFIFKKTRLTDGSHVFDVDLIPNTRNDINPMCIFSCTSEGDAHQFLTGLNDLVRKHTLQNLDETT